MLLLDQKFDTVGISAVLEHLKNPDHLISQLSQYLKSGGQILLTTPTPLGGVLYTLGVFLGLLYREAQQEHEVFHDKKKLTVLFEKHGLYISYYQRFLFD